MGVEKHLHDCLQSERLQILEVFHHRPAATVYLPRNDNTKIDWAAIFLCLGDHVGWLEAFSDYCWDVSYLVHGFVFGQSGLLQLAPRIKVAQQLKASGRKTHRHRNLLCKPMSSDVVGNTSKVCPRLPIDGCVVSTPAIVPFVLH